MESMTSRKLKNGCESGESNLENDIGKSSEMREKIEILISRLKKVEKESERRKQVEMKLKQVVKDLECCEREKKEQIEILENLTTKMKDRKCPICFDRETAVLFLPCRHLGSCSECRVL